MTPFYLPLLGLLHVSVKQTSNLTPGKGFLPNPEVPVLCDLQILDKDFFFLKVTDTSKAPYGSSLFSCVF